MESTFLRKITTGAGGSGGVMGCFNLRYLPRGFSVRGDWRSLHSNPSAGVGQSLCVHKLVRRMSVNNIFTGGDENFLISFMLKFCCDKWNFKPYNTKPGTLEQLSDSWPRK